jgi:PKD repeat protein
MMSDQFPAGGLSNHGTGTHAGQENSDECAWIAAGSTGGAANVSFATGTFAEQASWSNDTNNCAISHAIVSGGGGGGSTPVANFTSSTSGLTATFTDSSTDTGGTITAHAWTFGDGGTSTATSPSHTYAAAGTYTVTDKVTDNLGATNTKTSTVTVSSGTGGNVLTNGVAVTGLAATTGNKLNYTMAVPAGATGLTFAISGGTGDADLYVKFGSAPTLTSYDCRPYITGNNESCPITTAQAGTYYVMLNSYASFTGVSLKGSYSVSTGGTPTANFSSSVSGLTATFTDSSTDSGGTIGSHSWTFGDGSTSTATSPSHTYAAAGTYSVTETVTDSIDGLTSSKTASVTTTAGGGCGGLVLCNGVAVALPATSTGSWTSIYTMQVLAGHTATFAISGGTPDADLYVKAGSAPTLSSYNCRPYTSTSTESCTFTPTTTTTYYIGVEAYQSFSGVSLKGTSN